MKIQEEHFDQRTGVHYFEQTFTTQTVKQLSFEDYNNLKMFIETCVEHMSNGRHISLWFNDITDLK